MKKIIFLTALLCTVFTGLTSCSDNDNDNNNSSSSSNLVSMADAKVQVAASEAEFNSKFNLSDFTSGFMLVKYFNSTYGSYTRENDSSVIPFANLLSMIQNLAAGNLAQVPSFLNTIAQVAGTYRADTLTKKWVAVTDSTQRLMNKHLTLYFNDANGKECVAQMLWSPPVGGSDSLTISDADETIKITLPGTMKISLVQDGVTVLSGLSDFDYDATSGLLNGLISITTKSGYGLNVYMKLTQNSIEGNAIMIKNGSAVVSGETIITGTNFISHIMDHSVAMTTTSTKVMLRLSNAVGLGIDINDFASWGKAMLSYRGKTSYTDAEVDSIVSISNKYVNRILFLFQSVQPVALMTFQPRETPASSYVFGCLDTRVNFLTGESCMLNELFTGGERMTFVALINALLEDYRALNPGGTTADSK